MFKKSRKLPTKILVPKSSKCIPPFHKCVDKILSLEVKPDPLNSHRSFKLSFSCCMRRVNTMLFLGKINDIITLFTPRSIQDLPMLIITSAGFSVFNLSCLMIYIIRNDM